MTPEIRSSRARVATLGERASVGAAIVLGLGLVVAAVSQLARPIAIVPSFEGASRAIVAPQVAHAKVVAHAANAVRATRMVRAAKILPRKTIVARGRIAPQKIARHPRAGARVALAKKPAAPANTVAKVVAPARATPRAAAPIATRFAKPVRPTRVAKNAQPTRLAKRVAERVARVRLATPEPPLGYDARPQFVGARADAPSTSAALDGLRVRGRAIAPAAAPTLAPLRPNPNVAI